MKSGGFDFSKLKTAFNQAVQTAATTAEKVSKAVAQEVVGAKCLLDYTLQGQVASAGPGCLWKVYLARAKKEGAPYPLVSAWILDKRALQEDHVGAGSRGHAVTRPSFKRLEAFLEQCRKDVQHLARLKHPSVVRLVAPLEETRTQLVFITEPIFSSLEDLLHGGHGLLAELAVERRQVALSELEIKHGLLQVATEPEFKHALLQVCDGLHFLHTEAGMVHKAVSPESIIITHAGAWKLAGFGFAASLDYAQPDLRAYDYSEPHPPLLVQVTQPPLPYTAPELVAAGAGTRITASADVFSLAAVAYEALAKRQLLPVASNLADYESRVHSMAMHDLAGCPLGLEQVLRQMLASAPAARPPVVAFAGCQYFQGDVLLRGLKFLDTLLQRDALQKAAFLKDLPALCAQFDTRVLKLQVLPPLLQELRSEELQPLLLPIVLRLVEVQDSSEFGDVTLPALRPLLGSAMGEALLLLTQQAGLLARVAPKAAAAQLVPQLLVRAAEHGDVRCQEEMLRQVGALAEALDYEALKGSVLPAVHALCLNTTSAGVRVGAFTAMGRLVGRLDQPEAAAMLGIVAQVTAVDKTPATTMCALGLGDSVARQWGPRVAAERVLPVLCPLLVVPSLNTQQFQTAMKTIRELLARVEKARGPSSEGSSPSHSKAGAAGGAKGAEGGGGAQPSDWLAATSTVPASSSRPASVGGSKPASPLGASSTPFGGSQPAWGGPAAAGGGGSTALQQQQPAWQAGGGGGAPMGQPRSPPANGFTAAPAAADPFAWPPPQQPQQAQQQAAPQPPARPVQQPQQPMGPSLRAMGAPMHSTRGSSGLGGAAGDPFAGLQLSGHTQPPAAAGSAPAGGLGMAGGGIGAAAGNAGIGPGAAGADPFDALVLTGHGRPAAAPQQQQWKQQQGAWGGSGGDSLI